MSWTITPSFTQWTPALISTALWLDAADASTVTADGSNLVSQVNDKSGNGRNFTASAGARPTYSVNTLNGRAVFSFAGSQWLTSSNTVSTWNFLHQSGGAETIGVWKAGNIADPNTFYGFWGTNAGTVNNVGIFQAFDDRASFGFNDSSLVAAQSSADFYVDRRANNSHLANSATMLGCSLNLGSANAANKINQIINGSLFVGNNTDTSSPLVGNAAFTLQLGAVGDNVLPLTGYIAEFIVSASQLSTINRQKLEGYLAHKWGLTANLPSNHPYKVNPPAP